MEQRVESSEYETIVKMTEEYGHIVDELKAELGLENLTAQQYDYCFATLHQYWYGGKTPPRSEYMLAAKAFENIVMKHKIYGMPSMWHRLVGLTYLPESSAQGHGMSPELQLVWHELKRIIKSTAQYKLSDTTLGQIALANHDRTVGLEYERKGAVERAILGTIKDASQLPKFDA